MSAPPPPPPPPSNHEFGFPGFRVESTPDIGSNYLFKNKWSHGMARKLCENVEKVIMRYFILDDSGSMAHDDGQKLFRFGDSVRAAKCSRWEELKATTEFHLHCAKSLNAPSDFRFLNALTPKRVGISDMDPDDTNLRAVARVFEESPRGQTPLCEHIRAVVNEITRNAQALKENNALAAVIIITDGDASDGDVARAMQPLAKLPCLVVVRLCTDEEHVVNYWNNVDSQLELELDILDDLMGEAKEVYDANPWIVYSEALHRMREFGMRMKEMDLLDEKKLTTEQMLNVVSMLLGCKKSDLPHPNADFSEFIKEVKVKMTPEPMVYNTITARMESILNLSLLRKFYNPNQGCCSVS